MGYFGNLFRFESKAQREKRQKEYERRIFPFGVAQRHWERDTLTKALNKPKEVGQQQYELLILRENLYNTQLPADEENYLTWNQAIASWERSKTNKYLKPEERSFIRSMAILENAAASLEELPTIEEIREHATKQ